MQLFAPEILMDGHGLSVGISAVGLILGVALWVTGWMGHRFWIVLTTTVGAGIIGLVTSSLHGMKPLLAGILLAIAAGVLALALIRLVVFAAAGGLFALAFHNLGPAALDEPLGWFLAGGLLGLLLFRFWTMVLTSGIGALVAGYSLLFMLDTIGQVDAVSLCERKATLLSALCLSFAGVGVVIQVLIERRRLKNQQIREEFERQHREREEEVLYGRRRWFNWGRPSGGYREAS
jgi:hypothetical protein